MTLREASACKGERSVIYLISNTVNGKGYVGSTNCFSNRMGQHLGALRRGGHHSMHLQKAWDKYGESSFKVEIVEYCSVERLIEVEQVWLDKTEYWRRGKGYNICREAGRPNEMTEEERAEHGFMVRERMRGNAGVRVILNPEGEEVEFGLVTDLCAEYGLHADSIYNVLNDKVRQHKGWMLPLWAREARFHHVGKEYQFIRPDGVVEKVYGMREYCKGKGLCEVAMRLVGAGKQSEHRGYKALGWDSMESRRVPMREFRLKAPDGAIVHCTGIKATARLIGADKKGLSRLLSGKQKTCHGYTLA